MAKQYDFKKEWKKTRAQLAKFSQEAVVIAKKGEQELIKFSRKSKLHVDATSLSLKKEQLYYLIGKEYASVKEAEGGPSPKLKKLMEELRKAERQQQVLKRKLTIDQKTLS